MRLSEKGYSVLVIEKGGWKKPGDFPETNWNLKRWLWLPIAGFRGIFKLTFFRHLSVVSGVGVGGGSLVYANTLPVPKNKFFNSGSWKDLMDWKTELFPYYGIAKQMLGVTKNPKFFDGENFLKELCIKNPGVGNFENTEVAVYFGDPDQPVKDPYYGGAGPDRIGCSFCGKCMTGCNHGAKNTLDKNYLFFAQKAGAEIMSDTFVTNIIPQEEGYEVEFRRTGAYFGKKQKLRARGVVLSGGVLGTVPLLLKMKDGSMPLISDMAGKDIRSNNESLIFVTSPEKNLDMSKGIAIGAIWNTDSNSHLETVRYGSGSGFWRSGVLPMITETSFLMRFLKLFKEIILNFTLWTRIYFVKNFAKQTIVLLYMEDLEGKLSIIRGKLFPATRLQDGEPPNAFLKNAHSLAIEYSRLVKGKPLSFFLESFSGIPSTAHILGGAVIGKDKSSGVIDCDQKLFGYENFYVCDGSTISANPGVNPALTITAMTERAMSKIPGKNEL